MKIMARFAILFLAVPVLSLAGESPADSERAYNPLECRPVVLVGGLLQGTVVCKTRKEWLEYDRQVRDAVI
jgi:hypothetical protein